MMGEVRMGVVMTRRRITAREFRQMAETGIFDEDDRIELLEGDRIELTPIGPRHAYTTRQLFRALAGVPGIVLDMGNPLLMPGDSEFYPDIVLLRPREDDYRELPNAEDALLVIEVSDSSPNYDCKVKAPLYARAGVPELWIVDVEHRCVWVHRDSIEGDYREVRRIEATQPLTVMAQPLETSSLF
jgi:Uma2 family endonuclease